MCVVDEATMVPTYMTPIIVSRAGDQIAFVGDFKQLAPTTHVHRLAKSEMERWKDGGGQVMVLNVSFPF